MEIQLQDNLIWDDSKKLFEQEGKTIGLILDAIQQDPYSALTEDCLAGFTRPTELTYQLNDSFNIQVNPIYTNSSNSREFLGVSDPLVTIISK